MNWSRIWSGTVISAAVLWLFDFVNLVLTQRVLVPEPNLSWPEIFPIVGSLIIPSLVIGFLLSWLYALSRPRLGPGPATALLMGSIGFAFSNSHFFGLAVWTSSFGQTLVQFVTLWLKFAAATYFAGWQYIEKAPD